MCDLATMPWAELATINANLVAAIYAANSTVALLKQHCITVPANYGKVAVEIERMLQHEAEARSAYHIFRQTVTQRTADLSLTALLTHCEEDETTAAGLYCEIANWRLLGIFHLECIMAKLLEYDNVLELLAKYNYPQMLATLDEWLAWTESESRVQLLRDECGLPAFLFDKALLTELYISLECIRDVLSGTDMDVEVLRLRLGASSPLCRIDAELMRNIVKITEQGHELSMPAAPFF